MSDDPRLKEPEKPVWQMSPEERLAEGLRRRAVLLEHVQKSGVKTRVDSTTIIIETTLNNYFVDMADEDPRFIKIQAIYDLASVTDQERIIAAQATTQTFGAKAAFEPFGERYRLRFFAEIFAADFSHFTESVGIYQALIEDCRERFLTLIGEASS